MLVGFLIIFFICLIVYQFFLANWTTVEGLENDQSPCSSSVLAYKNSAAIEILQEQVSKLTGLDKEVQDISGNVVTLNDQVTALVKAQADASQQLAGNKPLAISGTQSA
jgi:uncharacterized protein YoxC